MADAKQVGLTLDPNYYEKLRLYAFRHQWSLANAARVIVMERLDTEKEEEEG